MAGTGIYRNTYCDACRSLKICNTTSIENRRTDDYFTFAFGLVFVFLLSKILLIFFHLLEDLWQSLSVCTSPGGKSREKAFLGPGSDSAALSLSSVAFDDDFKSFLNPNPTTSSPSSVISPSSGCPVQSSVCVCVCVCEISNIITSSIAVSHSTH